MKISQRFVTSQFRAFVMGLIFRLGLVLYIASQREIDKNDRHSGCFSLDTTRAFFLYSFEIGGELMFFRCLQ